MSKFSTFITALADQGWAMMDEFLPADALAALSHEAQQLRAENYFRQAGVGSGNHPIVRSETRGDQIIWLDEQALTTAQKTYWAVMEELRRELNRELYLSLVSFEAHYAIYPPGAYYQKHVDRFAASDERVISCTLYLNPNWQSNYGGQLLLYLDNRQVEIEPRADTFVAFRSDNIAHEVRPASRDRYSLTGWFRRRSLRAVLH
jgi:SM-20-related protein